MASASVRAHEAVRFASPLSEAAVDRALRALAVPDDGVVVETGCGGAELLIRALELFPSCRGIGVDLDPDWLARAAAAAAARGVSASFIESAASTTALVPADAVINVAASHAHGGFPAVLGAFTAPRVLYGEGFWARPPRQDFLDALGGATADELPDHAGLLDAIAAAGFTVVHEEVSTAGDWAFYEESLADRAERNGDHDYAQTIRVRRALPHGTTTLGFTLLTLKRA